MTTHETIFVACVALALIALLWSGGEVRFRVFHRDEEEEDHSSSETRKE